MLRSSFEEGEFVIDGQDFVSAVSAIQAPSPLAWIGINPAAIKRDGENARKHRPCVICLAPRPGS
jgi:hypothetical protein